MSTPVDTRASVPVTYLTDVEGMWSKLASFAQGNPLVSIDDAGQLHVADGAVFVFGGDAIDRGPDGRRVVATLLAARRRQPDRIVLLAGNRDLNKLRLPRELDAKAKELKTKSAKLTGKKATDYKALQTSFTTQRAEVDTKVTGLASSSNDGWSSAPEPRRSDARRVARGSGRWICWNPSKKKAFA